MNLALRQRCLRTTLFRAYASSASSSSSSQYVPRQQLRDIQDAPPSENAWGQIKSRPLSPAFYTTKSSYYDQMAQIERAISSSRKALTALQLLPLPSFARDALPPLIPAWKAKESLSDLMGTRLTTSRYRKVTALLNQLNNFKRIAVTAGCTDLARGISQVVEMFESGDKESQLAKSKRPTATFDAYGRTYSVGKRKTSSARVWIVPTKTPATGTMEGSNAPVEDSVEALFGLDEPAPEASTTTAAPVTTTTVLVNNIPLAEYFKLAVDRERVIRPLRLAGVLGGYNVFCLVRGGGTTGQSGAIAHGIAKGIAMHAPEVHDVLRAAKLLRRDPRMVERKKTGLAKARKRYAWVKR